MPNISLNLEMKWLMQVLDRDDDGKCILPTCNGSGHLMKTFKLLTVKKRIECATELHVNETL